MTFIEERVREIGEKYAHLAQDVLVLRLTEETLKLILVLNDGTTLRLAERWQSGTLARYSYYWLDVNDRLKIGWDNAPHYRRLDNFPHHKHVGEHATRKASYQLCLEDVMVVLEKEMTTDRGRGAT